MRLRVSICAVAAALLAGLAVFPAAVHAQIQGGTIEGRIFVSGGEPVAGIRVGALAVPENGVPDANATLMSLAQADADGRYRLEDIPPGRYYLVAGPLSSPLYFPGVRATTDATIVAVSAKVTVTGKDFRPVGPLVLRVRGRVTGEGRATATQATLINPADFAARLTTPVSPDGTFEFPMVWPGRYDVMLSSSPMNSVAPVSIVLSDRHVDNLVFDVPLVAAADMQLGLNVTVEGGGPLPQFALQLIPSGTLQWRSLLVRGSSMRQRVPAGEYRVLVASGTGALPPGYFVKSMMSGSTDLRTQPLKIGNSGTTEVHVVLGTSPPAWVKVSGRVTGITMPGSVSGVRLEGPAVAVPLTASVNSDGTFELPAVLPGTYQARLMPGADPFIRTVIVERKDIAGLELPQTLPRRNVEGRVADVAHLQAQGIPGSNQRLRITLRRLEGFPIAGGTEVAGDGTFIVRDVQSGNYILGVALCESDVCMVAGGIPIQVADRDVTGLAVPSGRTSAPGPALVQPSPAGTGVRAGGTPQNLKGTVAVEPNSAPPQFRLRFAGGGVTRTLPVTGASFEINLPPGEYTVTVSNLPEGYEVQSLMDSTSDLRTGSLLVGAGSPDAAPRIRVALRKQ